MLLPIVAVGGGLVLGVAATVFPALWLLVRAGGGPSIGLLDVARGLLRLPRHGTDPAAAFGPAGEYLPGPLVLYPVLLGSVAVVAAMVFLAIVTFLSRRTRGEGSQWATARTLAGAVGALHDLRGVPGRVILGRLDRKRVLATEGFTSVLVFGPSGSGKSTGFAEPAIVEHTSGPTLVVSMKSDLAANTMDVRNAIPGGRALLFDPTRATGLDDSFRCGWSPLARCRTWSGTKRMASWLTSVNTGLVGADDKFWRDNAAMLLEPALFVAANTPGATMRNIVEWVQTPPGPNGDQLVSLWNRMTDQMDPDLDAYPDGKFREHLKLADEQAHGVLQWDAKALASTRTTALNVLKAYTDPSLVDCTAADSINIAAFLSGPHSLFVAAPATEQEFLRPLFAAMVKDILHEAFTTANLRPGGSLEQALLVVLDEVANIAPIPDLDVLASTCRSHAISLVTITQSYSQLVDRWGAPRAKTIFDNHGAKVLLRGSTDADLLQQFRRLVGERQEIRTTRSRNATGGTSTNEQIRDRALALEHELRALDAGTGMVLYGSHDAAMVKLRPFYSDPAFADARNINARASADRQPQEQPA